MKKILKIERKISNNFLYLATSSFENETPGIPVAKIE